MIKGNDVEGELTEEDNDNDGEGAEEDDEWAQEIVEGEGRKISLQITENCRKPFWFSTSLQINHRLNQWTVYKRTGTCTLMANPIQCVRKRGKTSIGRKILSVLIYYTMLNGVLMR